MIEAKKLSWNIRRGDSFSAGTFRFISSSGTSFWDNFVVKCQLRSTPDGALVHEMDLSDAEVTEEDGDGVLSVPMNITATATAAFDPGKLVGDFEITSDSLPKSTVITINATVYRDVTHA